MSGLDLFQKDQTDAMAIRPEEGRDLPVTMGDGFRAAWNEGALFGQSISGLTARTGGAADYAAEIEQKTGDQTLQPALATGGLEGLNKRIAALAQQHPDLGLKPLDQDEIERRAIEKSRQARQEYARVGQAEKTFGGQVGFYGGSALVTAADPVNLVAFPVAAPEALGVVGTALAWGGIAGGTQLGIEMAGSQFHEQVQPGYAESGEPARNIAGAALFGAGLGGTIKGLGAAWTRVKTGTWPQSVRDAGNIIESEANVATTNPMPGVEGEVAHREALAKAIDDVSAGNPVDVGAIVPPDLAAAAEARFAPLMEARRNALGAEAPEAAAPHAETVADQVQDLARSAGYDMPRDEAAALAQRVIKAPDDEAEAILGEAMLRPRTLMDTLPSATAAARERKAAAEAPETMPPELAAELTPKRVAEMRADPELDDTILRDLDRLRAERGNVDVPMGETIDPVTGERTAVTRKVDDVLAEADSRLKAADEIQACVGPQPEAAE